ncbi:MAG: DeoR/GlpR family DNA-binding transcription regulator [Hespellia sp.]|nr:DeoR/GlpR family DNA-binding transcription regulator [Hespellia sp.]
MANGTYYAEERQVLIKEFIDREKRVSVNDLIDYFKVSPSTIRNDLSYLKKNGLIQRTHGGAMSNDLPRVGSKESGAEIRTAEQADKKMMIAKEANKEINDGDTIALLTGTTVMALAQTLTNKKNLTIVVNDLNTAKWLEDNTEHNIFVMGGFVRKHQYYMNFVDSLADTINVDKVFFGCTAFSIEKGATVSDYALASSQRKLMKRAESVILLCDSSKFGEVSFANMASISDIDIIVTDNEISAKSLTTLRSLDHVQVFVGKE